MDEITKERIAAAVRPDIETMIRSQAAVEDQAAVISLHIANMLYASVWSSGAYVMQLVEE